MQIYPEINKNPNLSLALGFFDGVHLGHKAVIESAVKFAKQNNTKSAVITFKDHPCCFLWDVHPQYILTRQARRQKIKELGIDFLYELDFESISGLTAQDYLKDVLIGNFMPSAISTGWNHNFGYKKAGNTKFLKENSKKYGYEYFEIKPIYHYKPDKAIQKFCHSKLVSESSKILSKPEVTPNFDVCEIPKLVRDDVNREIISSTSIRKYLQIGKIEKANSMLGYNFSVSGNVVKGNQIGRTIGFRTANIDYPSELIELKYGVYSVNTNFGKGIANFGIRPTVNTNKPVLEVHILDFDKDIYGQNINIEFSTMLRPERKFKSLDDLKEQIKKDIDSI